MNEQLPIPEIVDGKEIPCRRCRNPFLSRTMKFEAAGAVMMLSATICEPCAVIEEREQEESRERYRQGVIRRQSDAREAQWAALCPVEFRTTTEGGKTEIARLEREAPKIHQLTAWAFGARGLIIRGKTRRCKTRSTWRLLRRLWVDRKSIIALTAARFDRECRDAAGNFTLSAWFDRLANVDVLFVDDLGKAEWTPATEASWFDLVDQRTRENRPIIITTNDDGASLQSRMSPQRAEAMIARLRDYCETIVF